MPAGGLVQVEWAPGLRRAGRCKGTGPGGGGGALLCPGRVSLVDSEFSQSFQLAPSWLPAAPPCEGQMWDQGTRALAQGQQVRRGPAPGTCAFRAQSGERG